MLASRKLCCYKIVQSAFLPLALLLSFAWLSTAKAEVGRIELHTFETETLTDQEFLTGKDNGVRNVIAGELRFPRRYLKTYPVVVMIHGSAGVSGYVHDWARFINEMGYAVFIVDSFSGRGLYRVNHDQTQIGRLTMIVDAYRAQELLAKHKRINKKRIAVMGFSRGGQVALYASMKRFRKLHKAEHAFSAYIAFYPSCVTQYKGDWKLVDKPIRIFHGAKDNYNPIEPCRKYVKRLRKKEVNIKLFEYPDAHHVFDYVKLKKPVILNDAQTTRNCKLKELSGGKIYVTKPRRKLFTYTHPCVEFAPTVGYNEEAHKKSKEEMTKILKSLFR